MGKSILIISYYIGTDNSVAGRRWAKFASQLIKNGHKVFLFCNKNNNSIDFKDKVHVITDINFFYPKILKSQPNNVLKKIIYGLSLFYLKFLTKGSYYDLGCLQKKEFQNKISKIINKYEISNVIVSGAPFSYLYYVALLRKKINFNFIADFRDAWTWSKTNGISFLKNKRIIEEKKREILVLKEADNLIVASLDLKIHIDLQLKTNKIPKKSIVLTNSIEFCEKEISFDNFNNSKLVISHIGTIPLKTKKYWKMFLNYLKETDLELKVDFYSNSNKDFFEDALKVKTNNINFLPRISETELLIKLQKSSFLLIFKQDSFSNTFSSKFFDYVKSQRPILAFSSSGIFSNELLENKIGHIINEHTSFKTIDNIILKKRNFYNHNYNWKKFSTENVTYELETLLL